MKVLLATSLCNYSQKSLSDSGRKGERWTRRGTVQRQVFQKMTGETLQDLFGRKSKYSSNCADHGVPMQLECCSGIRQAGQEERSDGKIIFPSNDMKE